MNPDWFIPHVIDEIGDRRQITYGLTDFTGTVSPEMRAFVSTRLAWLDQLTGPVGFDIIEDFSRKDSLRLGSGINPNKVDISTAIGTAFIRYQEELWAVIPGADFMDQSFII